MSATKPISLRPITEGARLLRAYVDRLGLTIPEFCDRHNLNRHDVERVMRGDLRRIQVSFALAIRDATGGEIGVDSWGADTVQQMPRGALSRSRNRPKVEDAPASERRPSRTGTGG